MQPWGARTLVCAALVAGTVAVTSSASAQEDPEEPVPMTIEVEPTSGAPGTLVKVSGTGCFGPGRRVAPAFFQEYGDPPWYVIQIDFTAPVAIADDGSWVGHLRVPRDDQGVDGVLYPDLDYAIYVSCIYRDEENIEQEQPYPLVPFDVLPAAPEPPGVTTPTTAPPTVPAPPPAAPVVTDPPFTG